MRFEVRAGGAVAILIGLGALSGAVFLLGLVAGYEMGRQQESSRQFAAVYPLPSPPAAEPSPSSAAPSAPLAAATPVSSAPAAPPAAEAPPAAPVPVATPVAQESRPELVKSEAPKAEVSATARSESEISSAEQPSHRKPYSVQIEAVMDRSGAEGLVARLRRMGYQSYMIEALIGGQTWYRVRVGPYATEQEARDAEQHLHREYMGGVSTH